MSQLSTGETVLVHVYPAGSGGQLLVERLFAGTVPGFGQDGPPAGTDGSGGTGTGTTT